MNTTDTLVRKLTLNAGIFCLVAHSDAFLHQVEALKEPLQRRALVVDTAERLQVRMLRQSVQPGHLRVLFSDQNDRQFWQDIDSNRSMLNENRSVLLVVTSEAHQAMVASADNLMSSLGGAVIEARPRENIEAMIFAGKIREARLYAAEQTAMELGGLGRMLAPPTTKSRPASGGDHLERSHAWLREHRNEHRGRWVALLGDSLIGSDTGRKALQAVVNAHPSAHKILVSWIAP